MSDRELEIFELSLTLMEALSGDKEAVADLTKLVSNHPELFTNTEDVSKLIKEVLDSPNLIAKNHRAKQDGDLLVAKKSLEETPHKMGDIGIRNDNGTNVIYHALKQDGRQFDRLLRRANKLGLLVGASLSHTSRPAELDADEKSSSVKTHSTTHRGIIPQSPNNDEETYMIPNQNTSNTHFITQDSTSNLSLEEQISLAKENQKTLNAMPKASDIDKDNTQESTQTQDTTQRVETQSQNSRLRRK